jgi:hypothetical protein
VVLYRKTPPAEIFTQREEIKPYFKMENVREGCSK